MSVNLWDVKLLESDSGGHGRHGEPNNERKSRRRSRSRSQSSERGVGASAEYARTNSGVKDTV